MLALAALAGMSAVAQDAAALARQAVQIELTADAHDHSHWLFFDVDRKPENTVCQWVAQTARGDLHRVLQQKGREQSRAEQQRTMARFAHDPDAQAKQRKAAQHDDKQSEEMLRLLPDAFLWTNEGQKDGRVTLHFTPNANFNPPTWAARVFAAMEGEMQVDLAQHRIVSLHGRLTRSVRFCGGLCGSLSAGGTFSIERRETAPAIWQIVETHVHIHGTALFFKNISQEEDELRSDFSRLPDAITFEQAEQQLMKQPDHP
ncbi:MAG TPA: hypothetical protein VG893_03660 [Terracidiphilus sp.]|nr:hypothetical protein [Terracidiphilus sp.]